MVVNNTEKRAVLIIQTQYEPNTILYCARLLFPLQIASQTKYPTLTFRFVMVSKMLSAPPGTVA